MNVTPKTLKQLDDALNRVIGQCPAKHQQPVLSDVYFMFRSESGELCAYDDDDHELCRQVVTEWRRREAADITAEVQAALQEFLAERHERLETLNLLRPFSFVLVDEDRETLAELYLVDDDTVLIPGQLMDGLEEDLDAFLKQLMEE